MIEENPLVLFTKQYLKRCEERQQKTEKVTDHKEKKENQLINSSEKESQKKLEIENRCRE